MDRVEAHRRLINLENALLGRSLAFSPVRDPTVEQARFPNLVALYWAMIDHNGVPPTQRDFARAVADDPLVRRPRSSRRPNRRSGRSTAASSGGGGAHGRISPMGSSAR